MKKYLSVFIILLLFIFSCESGKVEKSSDNKSTQEVEEIINLDEAVVVINYNAYYRNDVMNFIYFSFPGITEDDYNKDNLTRLFIDEFIKFQLLLSDAKKNNVKVSSERLNSIMNKIEKIGEDSFVIDFPISLDEYKKLLRESMIVKEWLNKLIEKNITVSEDEVKSRYEKIDKTKKSIVKYHVLHIVTTDYNDALNARRELLQGKSFKEVALKYSVGPEKDQGGDLGYIVLEDMPDIFQKIKSLMIKRVSPVYKSDYGYHIFQVLDKKEEVEVSYEVLKPKLYQEIFAEKVEKFINDYVEVLKKNAKITININNLNLVSDNSSIKNN